MDLTRREFIKSLMVTGACAGLASKSVLAATNPKVSKKILRGREKSIKFEKEAMFYEKLKDNEIQCKLCPKECVIGDRERGWCGVRENRDGTYYTLVYGNPCSITPDPIEKKPLNHFLPGSWAFSLATAGCNLNCKFCQNWEISQSRPEETTNWSLPPYQAVSEAKQTECKSIAFTYSEPTVFYEYVLDTSILAEIGLKSAVISAGFINPEPLKQLCKNVDAIKIDLKSFSNDFYRKICSAELLPVLNTLKTIKASGVWLEIVYLVIPTLNDSDAEIGNTAKWILSNLGPDVPLHFSRFMQDYQLKDLPATSVGRLNSARKIAMDVGLHYVYVGNVSGNKGESTYCPKCKKEVIKRQLYIVRQMNIVSGKCKFCGEKIPGIWA